MNQLPLEVIVQIALIDTPRFQRGEIIYYCPDSNMLSWFFRNNKDINLILFASGASAVFYQGKYKYVKVQDRADLFGEFNTPAREFTYKKR